MIKVLLVEDEKYIRDLYAHILKREGFEIDELDNGSDALARIVEHEFDLVLLDIMLPKMDGMQILEKLTSNGHQEKVKKIVLLTNLDEEVAVAKGISYGIRGYLVKSQYPPEKLAKEIHAFLS